MIDKSYPLSPLQQGMLFHALYAPGSGVDIEQIVCTLYEDLNVPAFQRAWERTIARHDALRTSYRWQGVAAPIQQVHREVECAWQLLDWTGYSKEEQARQHAAFLRDDRHRGFALDAPPLLRFNLIRCGTAEYRFVWTFHHILLDGRSFPLVLQDAFTYYEALRKGNDLDLPLARPYCEYIQWLQSQDEAAAEAFWRSLLNGMSASTPLGIERAPGQADASAEYASSTRTLSVELTRALRRTADQSQLTLNTLLQGAWAVVQSRYSGERDVIFGATRACRRSALDGVGTDAMVGLFINTLPVRACLEPDRPFRDLLNTLRVQSLAVRPYEHTPLTKIQEWSGLPHGVALFSSILVFENYTLNSLLQSQGGEWAHREFELHEQTNYPLTLSAYADRELVLRLEYDRSHFEAGGIERMLGHLQTVLETAAETPHALLVDIPLLSEQERHQILIEWNDTRTKYPTDSFVHEMFAAQAAATPDAPAIIAQDQQLTFGQLDRRSNQLARYLQRLGVGTDTVVGLCLPRSPEMLIGILGILKAGGGYLPLDPAHPPERTAFMLEDAGAPFILSNQSVQHRIPEYTGRLIAFDTERAAIAAELDSAPKRRALPESTAYVIYTSGSTGKPKGVVIEHRGLTNYLRWATNVYATAGRGALLHSPLGFDLTVTSIFFPLLSGQPLTLVPEEDGVEGLAVMLRASRNLALTKITPAHLLALNQMIPATQAAGRTNVYVIGGEELLAENVAFWRRHAPETRLVNEYGPTETVVGCCVYEVNAATPASGPVPIGRPIANTQLYVLDRDFQPVPPGIAGELYIGGAGLARGYRNRPELTAERFIPNPFGNPAMGTAGSRLYRTGDLARYQPDGTLEYLGRTDRQIKLRGFRIELEEIESLLRQHSRVREAAAILREVEPGGGRKQLVGYIVPCTPGDHLADDLSTYLHARLPDYMVPSAFVLLDKFPLTTNGKVDYRNLPAPAWNVSAPGGRGAPSTPVEKKLAEIWGQVLGVQGIGIHDNFFELGGDSIVSIQVVARASQVGLRVTPRQIFQLPTVAQLAGVAETLRSPSANNEPITGRAPLTPIQHWFFAQNLDNQHHWNQAYLLEPRRPIQADVLRQAFHSVLEHHDALRSRFESKNARRIQSIVPPGDDGSFSSVTLGDLAAPERMRVLSQAAAKLQSSLDLQRGPLVRCAHFSFDGEAPDRVFITAHHLVIDGVSWRILLEDLADAIAKYSASQKVSLSPKTMSYQEWGNRLSRYAESLELRQELDYWEEMTHPDAQPLPVDLDRGESNTEGSAQTVSVSLTAEETRALLQDVPSVLQTQVNDMLLTALVKAFSHWTDSPALWVDLEGHGREEIASGIDLSRTVGWFTTIFPQVLTLENNSCPRDAVRCIQDQLRRIPHKGIGYGVLAFLSRDPRAEQLRQAASPQVGFNYLGQFAPTFGNSAFFRLAPEPIGAVRSPRARRRHLIDIDGQVLHDRLEFKWTYSENIHHRRTIARLANDWVEGLRALIGAAHLPQAKKTIRDFPEAGLNQQELDALITELDSIE